MSYQIRFTLPDGRTGLWAYDYPTREAAQAAIDDRLGHTGFAYSVEEVPEPGSTAAHHVEILRARVKELEEIVEERGKAVTDAHVANFVTYRHLEFAICIGNAMRDAMRTGEWRAGHDRSKARSAIAGWDRWNASLAVKVPIVPVGASEAPGEGGDSDRRRLEALRAFLDGNEDASLTWWEGEFNAVAEDVAITAPTLAALADKLANKEAKP